MTRHGKPRKQDLVLAEHRERRNRLESENAKVASLPPSELVEALKLRAQKELKTLDEIIEVVNIQATQAREAGQYESATEAEGLLSTARRLRSAVFAVSQHEGGVPGLVPLEEEANALRQGWVFGLDTSRFGAIAAAAQEMGLRSWCDAPKGGAAPKRPEGVCIGIRHVLESRPGATALDVFEAFPDRLDNGEEFTTVDEAGRRYIVSRDTEKMVLNQFRCEKGFLPEECTVKIRSCTTTCEHRQDKPVPFSTFKNWVTRMRIEMEESQ